MTLASSQAIIEATDDLLVAVAVCFVIGLTPFLGFAFCLHLFGSPRPPEQ